ncbi:odorant receptor 4-like isoform X2 [Odontomachus brunneus]|uniref:odorant receptor 4-like isoform X2 n=1 Tax=Odontomachus brunneus TaxID=486640 RepID=UPI0013F25C88|nr:odorant receptor 4-like isoform X2 [Odontomachus brunneus]
MQTVQFDQAYNIISWNRWFLSTLGIWPMKINWPLFVFFCSYTVIHCSMGAAHLIKYFSQPEYIVANLTENVLFVMIVGKMLICQRSRGIMIEFLNAIQSDFLIKNYSSIREKTLYLRYNEFALIFIKVSIGLAGLAASLYFIERFFDSWSAISSHNASYQLPYQTYPFFEIQDMTTYFCLCAYQAIAVPVIVCGYSAPDSFVLSMALHICGQLAVLSSKIEDLLKDHVNYNRHIGTIVLRHRKLITLADILENNFNMIFLQQTLGTVFLLCLTTYHTLANSEYGDNTTTVIFMLYTCCVVSTILAYCYIGECLITESAKLRDTFYNTDWYNNPPSYAKMLSFCMTRSEKPLVLTVGKFCMLSLSTFTNIVKTSMGYLSMLRHFL